MMFMPEPLEILYEDDDFIAVFKPAGYMVHPADHPQEGDLVALKILRDQLGQHIFNVHRIDRPTCGVLLFAKNKEAARAIIKDFELGKIEKTYWAIAIGTPDQTNWECSEPLQKKKSEAFKKAHTSFSILQTVQAPELSALSINSLTLLEAKPKTGRYHQIRKHLLLNKTPIVGDYLYTGIETCDMLGKAIGTGTRMLLQAKELSFAHPFSKEITTISAPLDEVFIKALNE